MFRRQEIRSRQIHRVAGADRLVIGHPAEEILAILEVPTAQVDLDHEILDRRSPGLVIAGRAVDVSDHSIDIDLANARPGHLPGHVDVIAMNGHLDAAQPARLAPSHLLHHGIGNRITQLVRVPRKHVLGRSPFHSHWSSPSSFTTRSFPRSTLLKDLR